MVWEGRRMEIEYGEQKAVIRLTGHNPAVQVV